MSTLVLNGEPLAVGVEITDVALKVALEDGRQLSVPLAWFPRLRDGTPVQRANWRMIGRGEGIHWDDLDEDISVQGLLEGRGDMTNRGRRLASKAAE